MIKKQPVGLIILDGLGPKKGGTAAKNDLFNPWNYARTPNLDRYFNDNPHCMVKTSGTAVGLPDDKIMGNSEIGHMNIGAGRIPKSPMGLVEEALANDSLKDNAALKDLIDKTKKSGGVVHIAGLLSGGEQEGGNVHSSMDHIIAISKTCLDNGLEVRLHVITDGRDNPVRSSLEALDIIEKHFGNNKNFKIASIGGRGFAMDRDQNYNQTEAAYHAMLNDDKAERVISSENSFNIARNIVKQAIDEKGEKYTDEYLSPKAIGTEKMKDGDSFLFANFRPDRAVQICTALVGKDEDFTMPIDKGAPPSEPKNLFTRDKTIKFSAAVAMAPYSYALTGELGNGETEGKPSRMQTMFPPEPMKNVLPEVISNSGYKQYAVAESEKYAHVTRFIGCGRGTPFENEEWKLHESKGDYNKEPAMQAVHIANSLIEKINDKDTKFFRVNFANADMVGHTVAIPEELQKNPEQHKEEIKKILQPSITALEVLDEQLGRIERALQKEKGIALVGADHGNLEDATFKNHTTGAVPYFVIGDMDKVNKINLSDGSLCDIAPTILHLGRDAGYNLPQPQEMTGKSMASKEIKSSIAM